MNMQRSNYTLPIAMWHKKQIIDRKTMQVPDAMEKKWYARKKSTENRSIVFYWRKHRHFVYYIWMVDTIIVWCIFYISSLPQYFPSWADIFGCSLLLLIITWFKYADAYMLCFAIYELYLPHTLVISHQWFCCRLKSIFTALYSRCAIYVSIRFI